MRSNPAKKAAHALVAEIDEAELAVRLAEIAIELKRPPGKTAQECMDDLKFKAGMSGQPEAMKVVYDMQKMARAAIMYFGECVNRGVRPS